MSSYMFSEKAGLLAYVSRKHKYSIVNGAWTGTRKGDKFTVDATGTVLTIDDWVEVNPDEWSLEKRKQWYYS